MPVMITTPDDPLHPGILDRRAGVHKLILRGAGGAVDSAIPTLKPLNT